MPKLGLLLSLVLLAGACTSTSPNAVASTGATDSPVAAIPTQPPETVEPTAVTTQLATTTTQPSATTSTTLGPGGHIGGALPDGTPYTVTLDVAVDRNVQGISGGIMVDLDNGTSRVVGISSFLSSGSSEPGLRGLTYTIPTGQGSVRIAIYPEVAEALGDSVEAIIGDAITTRNRSKLPTLELSPPLRWATDEEIPLQMEVQYEDFVIRRGCGELAVACSQTGAAQVIPSDQVFSPAPEWIIDPVWIESPAPRPIDQPTYLDPGPLAMRGGHDVLWTGSEMIVWGGAGGDDRHPDRRDGAVFDPVTSDWSMLPPIPLEGSRVTRAVWADSQMIVVSPVETVAYDPVSERWTTIGDGLFPPEVPGLLVWTGEQVAAWTATGIHTFEPTSGRWTELPHPGFGSSDRFKGSLEVLDGELYAVGLSDSYCSGRLIARWNDTEWKPVPPVSLQTGEYADCSWANQTGVADGRLVIWDDNNHSTMAFDPTTEEWTEIATIPLNGTEGDSGPIPLDDGFLVPQWGEAALFGATTGEWTHLILPGYGTDHDLVWTGNELLMWGATCCYGDGLSNFTSIDAWRWSPPDS